MNVQPRMTCPRVLPAVCVTALLWAADPAIGSPTYSVADLGTLQGSEAYTPNAVNASGLVVGNLLSASPTDSSGRAFLYSNGQLTDITATGANGRAINASGTMTRGSEIAINDSGATITANIGVGGSSYFLNQSGASTSLPTGFMPQAMNDQGLIVGSVSVGGVPAMHPAVYTNGKVTLIGGQADGGEITAVNNSGHFVGLGGFSPSGGFYFDGSRTINLGLLPGAPPDTDPFAINIHDQIVGEAAAGQDATGRSIMHAFLSVGGGKLLDLNTLIPPGSDWVLQRATGINDSGIIVGYGIHDGRQAAFELVPTAQSVPEPTTFMFAVLCLLSTHAGRAVLLRKRREV